jgi:hypothetical protein
VLNSCQSAFHTHRTGSPAFFLINDETIQGVT